MDDDSNYKREEDRKWRERTEARVVALTSSETVQNDRLDEIDEEIIALKEILEGKPTDRDDNGIKGEILELSRVCNELRALMMPDHLGHGGVINRLKTVEQDREGHKVTWENWTKIVVAIIMSGIFTHFWPDIYHFVTKKSADPLDEIIDKAKHPKGHHFHRTIPRDTSSDDVSE